MYFIVGALIIALSASVVSIKTLLGYVKIRPAYKIAASVLIVWGWFAPLIAGLFVKEGSLFRHASSGGVFAGFFLFGLVFLIFVLLMARDFVWFSTYLIAKAFKKANPKYHPKNPESYPLLNKTNVAVVVCAFLTAFFGLYEGVRVPPVKTVEFHTDKFDGEAKFVLLTDLHLNRFYSFEKLEKIVRKTNALNPDAVFLAGDVFDDSIEKMRPFFKILQKLKSENGVYMVWGNHGHYKGITAYRKEIESFGIDVLQNEGLRVDGKKPIYVAGTDFPGGENGLKKSVQSSVAEEYRILLAHHPLVFDKAAAFNVDLQLSGHTHGGQIFPFHFLAMRANKYLAGVYRNENSTLYVSRGSGLWGPPLRLFAPSEITQIVVRGRKKDASLPSPR